MVPSKRMASSTTCAACGSGELARVDHYARCAACGYWSSDLAHDVQSTSAPDAEYELVSYEHTRRANYARILELLARRHARGARLLEIGCADGMFLDMAARDAGFDAIGIEPNVKMIAGNKWNREIHRGFFPAVLAGNGDACYDVIALNCVFEHVPDAGGMLDAIVMRLAPGGSVMLNVPVSSGLVFRAARALFAAGIKYPFDRIWQKGFVSPHLHYFAKHSLARLCARHGLALVADADLALFSLGGLYRRMSLDPDIRAVQRWSALAALYAYYPVSRVMPDARAFVFAAA
jgi:SAM-dependent methyltransferase